jgi:hypothetical protein
MDHAEVRDRLEQAAAEPGGMDRLLTGEAADTDVAEHLDGCADCRAELEDLRLTTAEVRDVIRSTPSADLRDRTLAHVASAGRRRGEGVDVARLRPAWLPAAWAGTVAAAAVVAGLLVWGGISSRLAEGESALAEQRSTVAGLSIVTDWALRLGADPEASGVRLAAADDGAASGTVLFSPSSGELVMVATGLPAAPGGQEYRCWIVEGGERVPIGAMYRAGALAYWAGEIEALRGTASEVEFGVSLVDSDSEGVSGEVVLAGSS